MSEIRHDIAAMLDNLHDGVYFVDRKRRVTYWNKAAERITGFKRQEVLGHRCADNMLIHVDGAGRGLCKGGRCPLVCTIKDGAPHNVEAFLHHKEGHRVTVSIRATPLEDEQGKIVGAIELFSDESQQEALRVKLGELEKLALLDPLTRLPNRRQLDSELAAQFALWSRSGIPFGVLFFDINHFKRFNDEHGHDVGDLALQTVAKTLAASTRPFDTIGRWGGEEFVGIFANTSASLLADIAERLCMLVRNSRVETDAGYLRVTVSTGGTLPVKTDTPLSILKRADAMMYSSKQHGRDRVTVG